MSSPSPAPNDDSRRREAGAGAAASGEARVLALGDAALTLELGATASVALNARVLAAREAFAARAPAAVSDIVVAAHSLTIHFDPLRADRHRLQQMLLQAAQAPQTTAAAAPLVQLRLRCGGADGPDLAAVAAACGKTPAQLVAALCGLELRVFMSGFAPGFAYMGLLPEWLQLPRRATPRQRLAAGAFAIAGPWAGVYPAPGPGGWHVLGRTDATLFDAANSEQPALLTPGTRVRLGVIESDAAAAGEGAREGDGDDV